jgi:hypothetical protein
MVCDSNLNWGQLLNGSITVLVFRLWFSLFNWINDDIKKVKNQQCLSITCFIKKTQCLVNKNVAGHYLFINYLSQQKCKNVYTVESVSPRRRAFRDYVNFMNFAFWINVTLTWIFNFTVLLSYRAIHVFLIQKFICPVTTHEHAT